MRVLLLAFAVLNLFSDALSVEEPRMSEVQQQWMDISVQELLLNKKRYESINPNLKAKNIILFIGDGMGISTLTAARTLKTQLKGELPGRPNLFFEDFPFIGAAKTYNTDKMGPDSAGTATAYLCGAKARSSVIGVDERVIAGNCKSYTSVPDSKIKCVPEYAAEAGKSVGLVTTKSITDASPAPVYAHSPERDWESDRELSTEAILNGCADIASQLIDAAPFVNVALGGGSNYFSASYRRDKRDLGAEWVAKKTQAGRRPQFVKTGPALRAINTDTTTDLLGLFASGNMLYDKERESTNSDQPTLTEMSLKALEILQKNPNGYFLFIEGAKIDLGHHNNLAYHALHDTLAFEAAITAVVNRVNLNDTLVLVSADHSHVFTFGSYMSRTNPIFDVTDSGTDLRNKKFTSILYGNGPGFAIGNDGTRPTLTNTITNGASYRFETAVPLVTETHACEDVAIYANGPQAHLVSSLLEQNTLAHLMMYSSCIGPHTNYPHCGTSRATEEKVRASKYRTSKHESN